MVTRPGAQGWRTGLRAMFSRRQVYRIEVELSVNFRRNISGLQLRFHTDEDPVVTLQ